MTMTITPLTKTGLLPYVGYVADDAGGACSGTILRDMVAAATAEGRPLVLLGKYRFVGWMCGHEPMVVAVRSYLPGVQLDEDEATELAVDLLREKRWFADPENTEPDFVI